MLFEESFIFFPEMFPIHVFPIVSVVPGSISNLISFSMIVFFTGVIIVLTIRISLAIIFSRFLIMIVSVSSSTRIIFIPISSFFSVIFVELFGVITIFLIVESLILVKRRVIIVIWISTVVVMIGSWIIIFILVFEVCFIYNWKFRIILLE